MRKNLLFIILICLFISTPVFAQDATPTPQAVEVTAADGLVLYGDFYATPDADGEKPAVLLLHMLDSSRIAWNPLIPALVADGYNVMAVDVRGFGERGDTQDWPKALADTQAWFDWMREQPSVKDDSVSVIGASISTGLALSGYAADKACVTAIVLSPVNLDSLPIEESVSTGLKDCSMLLIAGQTDSISSGEVRTLVTESTGEIEVHLFHSTTHGTAYLNPHNTTLQPVTKMILDWLDAHQPVAES